jgi:hypothetical protein
MVPSLRFTHRDLALLFAESPIRAGVPWPEEVVMRNGPRRSDVLVHRFESVDATAIVRTLAAAGDGDPLVLRFLTALVRAIVIACVVAAPTSADVWDGIDLWNKWPDILTSTVPDVDELGIWAPETPVPVPGNVLYGVHAALLYDGQYERLLMMRKMRSSTTWRPIRLASPGSSI